MVNLERWQEAQKYEHNYWQNLSSRIAQGAVPALDWYGWRSDKLVSLLRNVGLGHIADGTAHVIEVGSGPVGVVSFFPAQERVAVDPLEEDYSSDPTFCQLRDPEVEYKQGVGEDLPCDSSSYDLLIIENCIDHVRDVGAVMREIERVLKPDGVLYMTVNSRTRWGFRVHRLLSRLRIDRGHPHTFTPRRAASLVRDHGFEVLTAEISSALRAHIDDLRGPELRTRMKALLGVSEFLVSLVARRAPRKGGDERR